LINKEIGQTSAKIICGKNNATKGICLPVKFKKCFFFGLLKWQRLQLAATAYCNFISLTVIVIVQPAVSCHCREMSIVRVSIFAFMIEPFDGVPSPSHLPEFLRFVNNLSSCIVVFSSLVVVGLEPLSPLNQSASGRIASPSTPCVVQLRI
jgi:hypothetical protein